MTAPRDVAAGDGRTLQVYDSGGATDAFAIVWHHGSPHTGAPLTPLADAAARRAIRLVSYARPSYGGSTAMPGRDVAAAAADVARIADALGLERFATMGASGGGPHALACAALLGERVAGAVSIAGLAPFTDEVAFFAGLAAPGALRAAREGRTARARYAKTDEFDPASFTDADWAALAGPWAPLGDDAMRADAAGPDGLIDDDCAFAAPWGFDVAAIETPVLIVQGGEDRVVPAAHGRWLAGHIRGAELWLRPDDGHVSVLAAAPDAMDWLAARRS